MAAPSIVMAVGEAAVTVHGRFFALHSGQYAPLVKATLLIIAEEPSAAVTPVMFAVQLKATPPVMTDMAPLAVKLAPAGEMVAAEAAPARAAQAAARHRTFEVFMASFPVMRGATSRLGLNRAAPSR